MSHSLVAQRSGLPIQEITLFIFGGVAQMSDEPTEPMQELKIAAAGPATSLVLALLFYGLYYLFAVNNLYAPGAAVFLYLAIVNFVVIVFNLIPGLPLDGGRIFRALLWKYTKNLFLATRISSWVGSALGVFLIVSGFVLTFFGNFVNGIWFILIGFFMMQAARMAFENVYISALLAGVSVQEAMNTNPIRVPGSTTLEDFVTNYFMKFPYRGYPIVRDYAAETFDGAPGSEVMGFVTLNDVITVDRNDWNKVTIADLIRFKDLTCPTVDAGSNLKESLAEMVSEGHSCLLVLENDKLKGVVSQNDIMSVIAVRAALMKQKTGGKSSEKTSEKSEE